MGLQIKLIRDEIEYEDIPWDLENLFCDIDEKGVIDSFTKSIHYLERRKYDECESDYERKKKENMFSVVSKTPLDILTEMQDEVKTRIIEDNAFKNILIEFMDEDGSINIFNMFRNLYMRSNSEPFLEDYIRYKWCQDKIAELSKEEEKAKFESIGEEDMVLLERLKGYIDKVSEVNEGKLWKSPFDGEKAKEFLEECFCDSEMGADFRSFFRNGDSGKTGNREWVAIANVLGYLMSKGKILSKHEAISKAITGKVDAIKANSKNGQGYDKENSGGSQDFKDTIVPFMESKLK